ncbi:MAG: sporulation domain-containing protein [Bacteroidetes bacterium]|nr:MAG: sporulation domain-containing protein [Bacteroidota bacterium]
MNRLFYFFCFFIFSSGIVFGQSGTSAPVIQVESDSRLQLLLEKHTEVNLRGKGKGYRVQIYFGSDKSKAKEMKARFLNLHGKDVRAYEPYEQPNFKIRVGDFRTRLEAYRFMKMIKADFPAAFIVESEIEYLD